VIYEIARLLQRFQSFPHEKTCICLVLPNGFGPFSGGDECRNESVLRLVIRQVLRRPAFGHGDPASEVACGKPRVEHVATRLAEKARIAGAAAVDPPFPILQVNEVHTVEKRTAVQTHGTLRVAALHRVAEGRRIRADRAACDELVDARDDPFLRADDLPKMVEALAECVARPLRVALRPEGRE
jgi:hypothetical protein